MSHSFMSDLERSADRAREVAAHGGQSGLFVKGESILETVGLQLDDVVNFRVNAVLKAEFEKVCKTNHSTVSREIKRFMTETVRSQRVIR